MSIQVENVSKTFGSFKALDNVSLEIRGGELVALLGPSGSGKTTLLRTIAGMEEPDANSNSRILFDGKEVAGKPIGERGVGFVFQHYALFRHMSVFENVAFGLRVRPEPPSEDQLRKRVVDLLKLVQLEHFADRFPAQLSGGQRQRTALARALAIEPKVLLLDEPFGALDAKVRQGLRDWLRKLHQELHVTTVLVTHDQEEALEVADRVVVMNKAKIEQVGPPEEVFHQPASEFVMDFLGRVNVFRARIENGRAWYGGVPFEVPAALSGQGEAARVYVRPHELEIERHQNGHPALTATVQRVHWAGAIAKVSLAADDGHEIQVDLPFERFRDLELQPGERVHVSPKQARTFTQEYVI